MQTGNDLGERMYNAFSDTFSIKYKKAVIIGSDCIDLTASIIKLAYQHLEDNDVVVGPATDGGYYLLGMKTLHQSLFENILWSTAGVLTQTLAMCKRQHLTYYLLPTLTDTDVEVDLSNEQKKMLSTNHNR